MTNYFMYSGNWEKDTYEFNCSVIYIRNEEGLKELEEEATTVVAVEDDGIIRIEEHLVEIGKDTVNSIKEMYYANKERLGDESILLVYDYITQTGSWSVAPEIVKELYEKHILEKEGE